MDKNQKSEFRMLNPRLDGIFKMMFTQETRESRGALKSFLEACTNQKILEVTVTANELLLEYEEQRGVRERVRKELNQLTLLLL